jgi:hypothetical protein
MPTLTERELRPHPVAVRLHDALESLAAALTGVRLDALLASEARLADILADIARVPPGAPFDRAATARELAGARAMLLRCRRLGAAMGEVARISLAAQGGQPGYGRANHERGTIRSLEVKA